ncbi:hypothetical protein CNMCM8980_009254 [Aspergillus fumigatiaffinis]|uniref:Uncharacterized protein n=1 Tax=Aspergillus fumigatiaffinis TaxID=340414 RepID=A0A8H4GP50_9EURO|nr:hypothetical protein CNMCM5878_007403 [Aspergillus fumigatiaffinis]KAF4225741.1 hypothetical protein CNMCM6457_007788 [Aspergillus fumigatiaffinis]KAF4236178.1 hypothetical protein CNMCM6805_007688 [Aspergillus fumigatiaffinis]KAF4245940.1 hypothetical protein CNMCM8980_009254 [Aspergillus fumigatiaffinis]
MASKTRSQRTLSLGHTEKNAMEEALDDGVLRLSMRYRDFTLFLDLKDQYHKEFLTRLTEHTEQFGFDWGMLEQSKHERMSCAESFLGRYGMLYWGKEVNRERFLMKDSRADPASLCVYPERKKEIVRVIEMLLQKKARSILKANMTPQTPIDAPATSSSLVLTNGLAGSLSSRVDENNNKPGKRRAPDDIEASPSRLRGADAKAIRPFSSINDTASNTMRTQEPISVNEASRNINRPEYPGTPKTDSRMTNQSRFTPADTARMPEDALQQQTKFLVSASTQPNMAPVWVPFQIFQSAASFIAHMAEECSIHEWDPSAQLNKEISKWDSSPPAPQAVVAASVKFDWSEFFIRVRQGRDADWEFVMQELRKSWRVKGEDGSEAGNQRFHILVMLHVVS